MRPYFIFLAVVGCLLLSCNKKNKVADAKDYNEFLNKGAVAAEVKKITQEIDFWQERLEKDTGSYVSMLELASYQFSLFKLTGNIAALRTGDSLLKRSSSKLNDTDPEILFSLSQNSITQHQFRQAAFYNDAADKNQGDRYIIHLLEFDTRMELGQYADAYKSLEALKDKSAFDYLIRKAKWEDHKGNLEGAILLMEQAFEAVRNKKQSLYCWALSNLADMYGHAGRMEESYWAYLDVLKKNPANLYCLKGIAWIVFAHDNNPVEAKRILHYLLSQTSMPDLKLMLAEIAKSENKPEESKQWIHEFLSEVTRPGYGDMYNKHLISIWADEKQHQQKALALAQKEFSNRFTPETCDWLAWTHYQMGNYKEALNWSAAYVYRHTSEPDAMMHTAYIYAANGKKQEAKQLLEECLESSLELGPVASRQIREKLGSL
ncbi:MAG: tetratricopeptide repeat protein [Bacteroidota bacterium]